MTPRGQEVTSISDYHEIWLHGPLHWRRRTQKCDYFPLQNPNGRHLTVGCPKTVIAE